MTTNFFQVCDSRLRLGTKPRYHYDTCSFATAVPETVPTRPHCNLAFGASFWCRARAAPMLQNLPKPYLECAAWNSLYSAQPLFAPWFNLYETESESFNTNNHHFGTFVFLSSPSLKCFWWLTFISLELLNQNIGLGTKWRITLTYFNILLFISSLLSHEAICCENLFSKHATLFIHLKLILIY